MYSSFIDFTLTSEMATYLGYAHNGMDRTVRLNSSSFILTGNYNNNEKGQSLVRASKWGLVRHQQFNYEIWLSKCSKRKHVRNTQRTKLKPSMHSTETLRETPITVSVKRRMQVHFSWVYFNIHFRIFLIVFNCLSCH